MRLVHYDDPPVLIQHVHLKRNMRPVNHIPDVAYSNGHGLGEVAGLGPRRSLLSFAMSMANSRSAPRQPAAHQRWAGGRQNTTSAYCSTSGSPLVATAMMYAPRALDFLDTVRSPWRATLRLSCGGTDEHHGLTRPPAIGPARRPRSLGERVGDFESTRSQAPPQLHAAAEEQEGVGGSLMRPAAARMVWAASSNLTILRGMSFRSRASDESHREHRALTCARYRPSR